LKKALVVAMVMVMGLGALAFAGPMSGSWDTEICLGFVTITQTDSYVVGQIAGLSSTLTVDYTVCAWTFESVSEFGLAGWETQEFTADGVLGAFTFGSVLVFGPSDATFTYWDSTGGVNIAGINISGEFLLEDDGAGWTFGIDGSAGTCDLSADVYFNSYLDGGDLAVQTPEYCFCFTSVEIGASFPFCCIELVDVTLGFSNTGFDGITFSLDDVAVPGFEWIVFDIDLKFDDGALGKVLTLTPSFGYEGLGCIEFEMNLMTEGNAVFYGVNVYGIKVECDMGQGVAFSSHSYLDWPTHHFGSYPFASDVYTVDDIDIILVTFADLASYVDYLYCATYWEEFTISSTADACCGGGFAFDLAVYFGTDPTFTVWGLPEVTFVYDIHSWLFDVAKIKADFSVGVGSNVNLTGGLTIQDNTYVYTTDDDGIITGSCEPLGLSQLCIGFEVKF